MSPPIVSDPAIMPGKPVIAGTRITVESILQRLAAGESVAEIAGSYPHIDEAQVRAAIDYAASVLGGEEFLPTLPAAK